MNQALSGSDLIDSIKMFYNLNRKELVFICQDSKYNNIQCANFMKLIKPCFVDFFIETFNNFFNYIVLNSNEISNSKISIKFLMPLKLNVEEYIYSGLYLIPVFENSHIIGFQFIIIPIKKFEKEYLSFNVYSEKLRDSKLLDEKLFSVTPPKLFTDKQKLIVHYIEKGHHSSSIANILNLKTETIYKMNIRIKNILSDFFDIEFIDSKEAINYYKRCFSSNL